MQVFLLLLFILVISFLLSKVEATSTRTYSINSGPQLTYWPNPYSPVPNGTTLFSTTLSASDTFAVQNRGTGSNSRLILAPGDQGDEPWHFVNSGGVLTSIDIVLKNQYFHAGTYQVRISANPDTFFFALTSSSTAPVVTAPSTYSANQCASIVVTTAASGNTIKYQFYPSTISCTLYTSTGCVSGNAVTSSYTNSDATTNRQFSAMCSTSPSRVFVTFYEPTINSGLGYAIMNPPASYKTVSSQIVGICASVTVVYLNTPSDSVTLSTVSNNHCSFYSDPTCTSNSITGSSQSTSSSSFTAYMSCSVVGSESLNLVTSGSSSVSNTFSVLAVPVVTVDSPNVVAGSCAQTITVSSLATSQSLSFSFVSVNSTCGLYSASGCAANTQISSFSATGAQESFWMMCTNPTDSAIINVTTTTPSSSATATQSFIVKGLYLPPQTYDVSSCFPLDIYGFNGVSVSLTSSNTDNCLFYLYNDCDLNAMGFNYVSITPTSDKYLMYIKCAAGFSSQSLTVDTITTSTFPVFGIPSITLDPTLIKDQTCNQTLTLGGLLNTQKVSFSFINQSCSVYSANGCAAGNRVINYTHTSSLTDQAQFYLLCTPPQVNEQLIVHASAGDVSSSFPIIGFGAITNKTTGECFTLKQYGVAAGSTLSSTAGTLGDCQVYGTAGCLGTPSPTSLGGLYSESYIKCRSPMDAQQITTSNGLSSNAFITFGAPTITIDVTTIIAGSCTSFTLGLVNTQTVTFSFTSSSSTCNVYTGTSVNCASGDVINQYTHNSANGVPLFHLKCDRPANYQAIAITPNLGTLTTQVFTVIGVQPLAQTSYNTGQCFGVTINGFAVGTALSSSSGNCVYYGNSACTGVAITAVATLTNQQIIYSKCTSYSTSQTLTVGTITTSPFILFGTPMVQVTASTVVAGSCSSSVQLFGLIDTQTMTFSFDNVVDTTCNIYSSTSVSCGSADIITQFTQSGSSNPTFKIKCDRPISSQRISVAAVAGTGVSIFFPVTGIKAITIQETVGQCFNVTTFGFASGTALSFANANGNCAFYGSNACSGSAISTVTAPNTQIIYGKCSNAVSNQQITVGSISTSLFTIFGTPMVQVTASTVVAGSCSSSVQLLGLVDTQTMTFSFDNVVDTTCNIYSSTSVSCGSADIIAQYTQSGSSNPTFKIKCDRPISSQRISVAAVAGTGVSIFFPVTGIKATIQETVGQCFNVTTFGFASGTALSFANANGNCVFYGSTTCTGSPISTVTAPNTQIIYGKCTTPVSNQQITVGSISTPSFSIFGVPTLSLSSSTISTNVCNSLTLGGLLITQQITFSFDSTFGGCEVYSQSGCASTDIITSYSHSANSLSANLWLQCNSYSPSKILTAASSAGSGTLNFVVFGQPAVVTPSLLSTTVCSSGVTISGLVNSQTLTLSFSNTTMGCSLYSSSGCNIADVITTSYTHSISANNVQFWIQCSFSGVSQTILASSSAGTGTSNSFSVLGTPIVNVDASNVMFSTCSPTVTLNGITTNNAITFTFSNSSLGCKLYTTSFCSNPSAISSFSPSSSSSASFWMKCTNPGAQTVVATTVAGSSQQSFDVKGIVMGSQVYITGQCYPVAAYGTSSGDVLSSSNSGNCMLYESSSLCLSGTPSSSLSSSNSGIVLYMKCSGKASTQTVSFGSVISSSFSVQGIPFFDISNLRGTMVQNTCTVVPVKNISLSQAFSMSSTNSNCKFFSSLSQCNNNAASSLTNIVSPVDGSLTTYIKCSSPVSLQNLIITSSAGNFTTDPFIVSGIVVMTNIGQLDLNTCSPPITISNVAVSQFISFTSITPGLCSMYLDGSCSNSSSSNFTATATSFSVQIKCSSFNLLQRINIGGTSSNSFIVGLVVTNVTLQSFVSANTSQLVNVTLQNSVNADTLFSVSSSDTNIVYISSPLLFTAGSKSATFMATAANNVSGLASILISNPSVTTFSSNIEVRSLQIGFISPGNVTNSSSVYVIGKGFGNTAPAYMTANVSDIIITQGPNLKWMNDSYVILTLPPASLGAHNISVSLGPNANQTIQSNFYQVQYVPFSNLNHSMANNINVNYIILVVSLFIVLLIH